MSPKTTRQDQNSGPAFRFSGGLLRVPGTPGVRLLGGATASQEAVYRDPAWTKEDAPALHGPDDWLKLVTVSSQVEDLQERVERLERATEPIRAVVGTLAPSPYALTKPFEVVLEAAEGGFVASFYDANINASGDNQTEAFSNLKDLVVAMWELLTESDEAELGPGPARQLAVLREYVSQQPAEC